MKQVILKTIKKYNLFEQKDSNCCRSMSGGASLYFNGTPTFPVTNKKKRYDLHLIIAHVNHKKRANSDLDEELVTQTISK